MYAVLLYAVIAMPGGSWQGAFELHRTADEARCQAIAAQLSQAGGVYRCETLVKP